ncbi:Flavodoxin [Acinetobacter marinus]|uniref:Flavodoxin n=1 Tax=Acinetobacter marinus TaxID=281375 RepID=A0A1G6GV76_9GAMM|nr:flavodoxin [Acinetobacter marinus]SDB85917.1 Flavodoxin [Acinetobacter marinus]
MQIALKYYVLMCITLLLSACVDSKHRAQANEQDMQATDSHVEGKVLIVYLTRTKNTEALAKMIQQRVGGELRALTMQNPYPQDYQAIVDQVDAENRRGYLPALTTPIDDVEQFDLIFVGFPTWDMQLPPPVKSFLNQANLSGKIVVPFNNHAGYGLGQSMQQFRQYCKDCKIANVLSLQGGIERDGILFVMKASKAEQAQAQIDQWLKQLAETQPQLATILSDQ